MSFLGSVSNGSVAVLIRDSSKAAVVKNPNDLAAKKRYYPNTNNVYSLIINNLFVCLKRLYQEQHLTIKRNYGPVERTTRPRMGEN